MYNNPRTILQSTTVRLLLLSVIPVTKADCFYDFNTNRRICTGLSNPARVGVGIGIFVLVMLVLLAIGMTRRRRIQRQNQAYIANPNAQPAYSYNYNYNPNAYPAGNYNNNSGYDPTNATQVPQYPPPTHTGEPYSGQNIPAGYNAQPYGQQPQAPSPPQYQYAPPSGPPPPKE